MVNQATKRIIDELKDCEATIGTRRAAEMLGVTPIGFKHYLENVDRLPDWVIEVSTSRGERRTFRVLTERFASMLIGREEIPNDLH